MKEIDYDTVRYILCSLDIPENSYQLPDDKTYRQEDRSCLEEDNGGRFTVCNIERNIVSGKITYPSKSAACSALIVDLLYYRLRVGRVRIIHGLNEDDFAIQNR